MEFAEIKVSLIRFRIGIKNQKEKKIATRSNDKFPKYRGKKYMWKKKKKMSTVAEVCLNLED